MSDIAASEIARLRRERAALLQEVAWRADWMTRMVGAVQDVRAVLDADETWAGIDELRAEEFGEGEDEG